MNIKTKIELLLAKAEGTDNPNERDAYTAKAQGLMLKWGIDSADLEARGEVKPEEVVEVHRTWNTTYAIGWVAFANSVARGMGNLRILKSGSKSRHTAYAIGHKSDVEHFWMLMTSLQSQAEAALAQWWKTAPERQWGLTDRENYKSRRQFILGFGMECGRRLREQREEVQAEATPGAALVLVSKEARVNDWVNSKYSLKSGRGMSAGLGGTSAGIEAGAKANLGRALSGSATAIGG